MKKIIAFTFMVLFVVSFAFSKKSGNTFSTPENSIMFDIRTLNVKDKVKVENGSTVDLVVEICFYEEDSWMTVGKTSVASSEAVTVRTPYEDKLKKHKKNTWCVIFSNDVNSNDYHLRITENHHDLVIQIFEK